MSPNRAAKSLEILNVIAMQAVANLMAGPCSHSEVAAFRNPVAVEVEISMLHIFCYPFRKGATYIFTGLLVGEAKP